MHRTRIKFCGITTPAGAVAAAAAGADAVGVVLHGGSARGLTVDRAAEIVAAAPPMVAVVPLFVDAPAADVRDVAGRLRLTTVQLHGREPPAIVSQLGGLRVVKAVRPAGDDFAEWADWLRRTPGHGVVGLLLEAATAAPGGTGVENDWAGLAEMARAGRFAGLPPIVLAGGLTPETVGAVVRGLRPWAVDVSSGIESAIELVRGVKSPERMAAFAAAVARADAT